MGSLGLSDAVDGRAGSAFFCVPALRGRAGILFFRLRSARAASVGGVGGVRAGSLCRSDCTASRRWARILELDGSRSSGIDTSSCFSLGRTVAVV